MSRFFIVCLPRSRSAWLSNLLTYESVLCLHEPLLGCRSLDDLEAKLATTGTPIAGAADTGAMFWVDDIIERFPDARFVLLARDPRGYVEQAQRMGGTAAEAAAILEQFSHAIGSLHKLGNRTLTVASKQLDDYTVCNQVWQHIGMPIALNRVRFDMLKDLKVEVFIDRVRAKVAAHQDDIRALFGAHHA
ncbi:MAG: hypothetical protein KBF48_11280 [Xanthomonadales bacterium]|nr:hypothetical protein [Xanthomonadales bacterium]